MVETLLKLGIFMLSNFGYWEFFRHKCKIGVYYLPAFTIAAQFMVLFAAGLLNLLGQAATVMYLFGLLLFAAALRREKKALLLPYLNWGYGVLVIATGMILLAVKGKEFATYDNFSHWAIVVKTMLNADRFPNFMDSAIQFQSYPLGASAYIYYFCKMIYSGESMQMLAQAFMMLCMMLPWFAILKKNSAAGTLFLVLMANFLLCYNVEIYDLPVDTLLPLAGMAAMLFLYRECLEKPDSQTNHIYCAIPFLCLLSQIKSSGVFFVAAAAVLLLVTIKKKEDILPHCAVCASPLVMMYLWSRHCDYVFTNASTSKHSIDLENYSIVFGEKGAEDIRMIIKGVLEYAVSRRELIFLVLWIAVLGILAFAAQRSVPKTYVKFVAGVLGIYAVYTVGLIGMYLFSMPLAEAFGSMERYMKTIDIAVYYLIVCYALFLVSKFDRQRMRAAVSALLVLLMIGTWRIYFGGFVSALQQNDTQSLTYKGKRDALQTLLEEYDVPLCRSYFLCIPEYSSYEYYVCQYLMDSTDIYNPKITEAAQMESAQYYEYAVILDEGNPIIEQWLQENYPDQAEERVIYLN